jgi:hypothetical protein
MERLVSHLSQILCGTSPWRAKTSKIRKEEMILNIFVRHTHPFHPSSMTRHTITPVEDPFGGKTKRG